MYETLTAEPAAKIRFSKITAADKPLFERYLATQKELGCEMSFANIYLWGRKRYALVHDHIVIFAQFDRKCVYPYPIGTGDKKAVLDTIIADAQSRDIVCRITNLSQDDIQVIDHLYPGKFRFHCGRDSFDYVYDINDLADLAGKKYHKKRTHINGFLNLYPGYTVQPITAQNLESVKKFADEWYETRLAADPTADFQLEQEALYRAFRHYNELELEGLILSDGDSILAFTMASRLSPDTFDVHFEKGCANANGAYAMINREFARYIRQKHPDVKFLNREDDMGLEGLRKAKQSYYPHHMVEKCWARLMEDCDED